MASARIADAAGRLPACSYTMDAETVICGPDGIAVSWDCRGHSLSDPSYHSLPAILATPETVAAFIAAEAARGIKPASIGRRVAAIRYAHRFAGHDDPPTSRDEPGAW